MNCKKCDGRIIICNQGIVFENPDCEKCHDQAELALKTMNQKKEDLK